MSHHHELSTEKYWNESVQEEIKDLTRQKNRKAIRAFAQFIFAMAICSVTVLVIQQLPNWLPIVTAFMEQSGITESFGS